MITKNSLIKFEEDIGNLFNQKQIKSPIHLYHGNEDIMMEIFKRYGVTITNDNEADAYGLAQIGLALRGGNRKNTTKLQEEVLSLLKKQL